MARILNALPKVVFAHGGSEVEWNAARFTDAPVGIAYADGCVVQVLVPA